MNEQPPDREFEDFLRRRRPLFRRVEDDALEPPAELDRIVLRQAREAIQEDPPQRLYRAPRWGAPVAIAATLVVGLAFVFKAGMTPTEVRPQVTVENIAQRLEVPPPPPPPAAAPATVADAPLVVDLSHPPAGSAPVPVWREDSRVWMAEIERLRAAGDVARADAELAEYNRHHRALAVSPDR